LVKEMFDMRFRGKPYVIVQASVCRAGWLVEMECMAIKEISEPAFAPF